MNLYDAPTIVTRAVVPPRPPPFGRSTRMQKIAVCSVMLMLFELGFALGGYRARCTRRPPAAPEVTVVARPAPIEIPPIVIPPPTLGSVVRSEGARVRPEWLEEDRAVQ